MKGEIKVLEIRLNEKNYPIRFEHIRTDKINGDVQPKGGETVAYIRIEDSIYSASSLCSKKDIFSKERGRVISSGRLVKFLTHK